MFINCMPKCMASFFVNKKSWKLLKISLLIVMVFFFQISFIKFGNP
jgi:hypothetical protein